MKSDVLTEWTKWLAEVVFIAMLYTLTGKLGFILAIPPGNVTSVWIPSGIALAAILLRGQRVWPGVWLGSFLVNSWFFAEIHTTPFISFVTASMIGAGSSLQAIVGAWLIQRWTGSCDPFDRREGVFKFLGIEIVVCTIAPLFGVTTLFLGGFVNLATVVQTSWTWWIGDLIGVISVAPLLVVWLRTPVFRWNGQQFSEAVFIAVVLAVLGYLMFGQEFGSMRISHPLAFLIIPVTVWAAFRFGLHGVTLSSFAVSLLAIWGTANGRGPFVRDTLNESLPLLQIFVGNLMMTGLILAASVTERREKEQALAELGTRKSAMLEVALDCIITADHDGKIIDFNPAAERTFGYHSNEVVGRELAETIVPPSLRERHRQGMARYLATGEGPMLERRIEMTAMRSDGSEFPVEMSIHAIQVGGKPFFTSYLRDITERKHLEETQRKLAAIVESSDDAIIGKTLEGIIISWNKGAERIYGYRADEVLGRSISLLIPPDRADEMSGFLKRLENGEHIKRHETICLRKDGNPIDVSLTVSLLKNSSGKIIGISMIARDIADRKRAEEALQNVVQQLEAQKKALDQFAIVAETDPEGRITYVNDQFCKIAKYSSEELLGKDHRDVVNSGYHPKEFWKEMWGTISQGKIWRGDVRNRAKDGEIYWVDTTIVPFMGQDGKPEKYLAIRAVITERKLAEEALRHSEERFRAFMDNSPAVAFIKDAAGRYIYINEPFRNMFGRPLEELRGKTDYDVWPPNTAKQLRENDVAVLNANKTIQMFESVPTPDGLPHHLLVYKFPILDVSGQRLLGGVALDITDRRKLEAAREQLRVQYQEAVEKIKTLSGFLPICASCKKIRDDKGYWQQIEDYIAEHSEAEFSHGICPDCAKKLYPEFPLEQKKPKRF